MNAGAVGAIVLVAFAAVMAIIFLPLVAGNVDTSNIVNDSEALSTFENVSGMSSMLYSILPFVVLAFVAFGIVIVFLIFVRR